MVLAQDLAQKFINKVAVDLEYNLNIMNNQGIIIASKDASRIGDFHEVAYNMLTGKSETGVFNSDEEKKYIGTKPGINMFIDYKDEHVGVIGVTGDPSTLHTFASIVKRSMETMLEYELINEMKRKKINSSEKLIYYMLFEENTVEQILVNMYKELNLNDNLRAFIIIKNHTRNDNQSLIKSLSKINSYQDLCVEGRNNDIIVLKSFDGSEEDIIKNFKDYIINYIGEFQKKTDGANGDFSFYIGTIQNNIFKYKTSYLHAQSLILNKKIGRGIHFFYDNISDYFRMVINTKIYDDIFNVYESLIPQNDIKWVVDTIEALSHNNYNVVNSSKELYIHRNTLLFRLNKLKDLLNIDPIKRAKDRYFIDEFIYYINNK